MPIEQYSSNTALPHQLFHGTTWHSRLLPNVHKFVYPYRYWGVNISALASGESLPEISTAVCSENRLLQKLPLKRLLAKGLPLFSAKKKALQQFCPDDYVQGLQSQGSGSASDPNGLSELNKSKGKYAEAEASSVQALHNRLSQAFMEQAGSAPTGDIIGLLVCRNAGVYFSPVNFYLGFDEDQNPTHLLAEVSNTPWDKRHYYGFVLEGEDTEFCHDKDFHVSPFNPIDQLYRWQVKVKKQPDNCLQVCIGIDISDERGEVLKTGIKISGVPMTADSVRKSLRQNPLMNMTSLTRIYWHAFKLYAIKKVPYVNYDEKLADSQQKEDSIDKNKS
ncbi:MULTISPECIES: DUF1365 domain-containing protein [unclassified Psychrobacter]|uniref:DUF1365 domain-containing protein n=1 Tax=unclassified Psychrobacter TaxID=196806 RepID=UPI001868FEE9|nr:DUF1365 domain-containing protein [Psychrobacter sp. FME61]